MTYNIWPCELFFAIFCQVALIYKVIILLNRLFITVFFLNRQPTNINNDLYKKLKHKQQNTHSEIKYNFSRAESIAREICWLCVAKVFLAQLQIRPLPSSPFSLKMHQSLSIFSHTFFKRKRNKEKNLFVLVKKFFNRSKQ